MEEVKTESAPAVDNSVEAAVPSEAPKLMELLSEELREHKALQNYDTVDSMAKSLLSAQSMVGKKVQELTAEELLGLNGKFGKPADIGGYEFSANEEFKVKALNLGLNPSQAEQLHGLEKAALDVELKSREVDKVTRMDEVGKELEGYFGNQLEARVELAKKAALELGGEELHNSVFDADSLGDPKIIKALSEAGKRIFDHESVGTDQITKFGLTPQEASNEIALKHSDREFMKAYMNSIHPGHEAAVAEMQKLQVLKAR